MVMLTRNIDVSVETDDELRGIAGSDVKRRL